LVVAADPATDLFAMLSQPTLRRLIPVLLFNLIAFAVAIPILPALTLEVGGTATDVGFLFAIQSFGQFLMAPVWGDLSDRTGRKPVLIATIFGLGVFDLLTALATSLWWLYPIRLLAGMCAGNVATASAMIADATDADDRSQGMAIVGISFGVGFTIGPAIGAGVAMLPEAYPAYFAAGPGLLGTGLPFAVAAVMAWLTALAGGLVLVEPPRTSSATDRTQFGTRLKTLVEHSNGGDLMKMCGLFFAFTVAVAILEVTFLPYAQEVYGYDERQVGFLFAGMGLLMAAVQGTIGRISTGIGDRGMVGVGLILCTAGLAGVPLYRPLAALLAFLGVATVGRALVHPGILSLTSGLSDDPSETGKIMGVLQSSSSLGRIVGPAVGGIVFDAIAPGAPFFAAAAAIAAAGLLWWLGTDGHLAAAGQK
jgi:MFS family permease